MTDAPQELRIAFRRVLVKPEDPPRAAHHFIWARRGNEVTLDIGHFDLLEFHVKLTKVRAGEEAEPIEVYVTDRLALSREALEQLRHAVEEASRSFETTDEEEGNDDISRG